MAATCPCGCGQQLPRQARRARDAYLRAGRLDLAITGSINSAHTGATPWTRADEPALRDLLDRCRSLAPTIIRHLHGNVPAAADLTLDEIVGRLTTLEVQHAGMAQRGAQPAPSRQQIPPPRTAPSSGQRTSPGAGCPCGCGRPVRLTKRGAAVGYARVCALLDIFDAYLEMVRGDSRFAGLDIAKAQAVRGQLVELRSVLADHIHGDARPGTHPDLMAVQRVISQLEERAPLLVSELKEHGYRLSPEGRILRPGG